jgi:hypothetical protein
MASEIDIVNLALSRLGDDATVASLYPPEGSAQAEHAARFYPVARDALLEMHAWNFATQRAPLAALAATSPAWAFAYALPADCIVVLAVLPPDGRDQDAQPFRREALTNGQQVIVTDQPAASIRYQARVSDTTKFSPLFVDALAWLLASYLAGPILKGDTGIKMAQQSAQMAVAMVGRATSSDARQQRVTREHTPDWVSFRGGIAPASTWGR